MFINFGHKGFSEDDIEEMLEPPGRRQITNEWEYIRSPMREGQDHCLTVPFPPLKMAFDEAFPNIKQTGWRDGTNHTYYTYLNEVTEGELNAIEAYFKKIVGCVAIRDCLPISFAIDFDRYTGNPTNDPTEIGEIRRKAKPYGGQPVNDSHYKAADELVNKVVEFIKRVRFYNELVSIVGMPPSDPNKDFILTEYLASKVSKVLKMEDLSNLVKKKYRTGETKNLPLNKKLNSIRGSISVSADVDGQKILLLDDLYQSGITTNYVAMLLLEQGAAKVYSLSCEKTCKNDDNIQGNQ
ncbi:MAG: phosphoribosyltransferase [Nitrospirae bacterium]|nr:phosphoribosyltransferase [Nitrospirota bacterium]